MPAMTFQPLADEAALDAAFAAPLAVIFKHSTSCSLSAMAHAELRRYLERPDAVPVHLVDLLAVRPISNAIEARSGVRHESPQLLVLRHGAVQWHASHRRVTADALAAALTEAA